MKKGMRLAGRVLVIEESELVQFRNFRRGKVANLTYKDLSLITATNVRAAAKLYIGAACCAFWSGA